MDYCKEFEDESTPAKEPLPETEIMATKRGEGSIADPVNVMYSLWDQITFAEKLELETKIRATKQGGRCVKELFYFMDWMWYQMETEDLMKSRSFRKFEEENHLVQFLLALRDEYEPFKRSLLSRSIVPSIKEVMSELKDEEARLRSLYGYLEIKTAVQDDNEPASVPSSQTVIGEEDHEDAEEDHESGHCDSGGTLCNLAEFAAASPVVAEVSDHCGSSEKFHLSEVTSTIKILIYNVCIWDVELHERMKALCGLIEFHVPDIICFQEVRLESYNIFKQSSWWNAYHCSVSFEQATEICEERGHFCMQLSTLRVKSFSTWPFKNSRMGRELCMADIEMRRNKSLIVATSHLESPDRYRQIRSEERVSQAKKSVNCLQSFENVIFCGDMNWNDAREGRFPLPEGWVDAWQKLRPWLKGWTCDTDSNPMLTANKPLKLRSDRFLCKLKDFKLVKISMVGTEAIPGVSYSKEKRFGSTVENLKLPLLPSDHYGLMLEIHRN